MPVNANNKLWYIHAVEFYAMMKMMNYIQTTWIILTNKTIEIKSDTEEFTSV